MDIDIKEFLLNNYFMLFYVLALILSIITYRKYFTSILKYFPIIIAYTFITETLGFIIREIDEVRLISEDRFAYYNILIFNIFDIIFFLYFFYIFRKAIRSERFKGWINYFAIIFILCSILNPFYHHPMFFPQMLASTFGSLTLVYTALFYLVELKRKGGLRWNNLLFWISIGLSVFYFFYPFIILIGHFAEYEVYQEYRVRAILHFLIAFMYACFILGFLLMRPIQYQSITEKKP